MATSLNARSFQRPFRCRSLFRGGYGLGRSRRADETRAVDAQTASPIRLDF
jgi:hypothetical protein